MNDKFQKLDSCYKIYYWDTTYYRIEGWWYVVDIYISHLILVTSEYTVSCLDSRFMELLDE